MWECGWGEGQWLRRRQVEQRAAVRLTTERGNKEDEDNGHKPVNGLSVLLICISILYNLCKRCGLQCFACYWF